MATKKESKKTEEIKDILTIKVYAHYVENGDFTAYKTKIGALNLDVKLTKETEHGELFTEINDGESAYVKLPVKDLSLDTRKKYPVLWVR